MTKRQPRCGLTQKGCTLYDKNPQKIFIRRDVTFNEIDFGSTRVQMKCDEDGTECAEEMELKGEEEQATLDEQQDLSKDSRRSGRERNPQMFYHDEYAISRKMLIHQMDVLTAFLIYISSRRGKEPGKEERCVASKIRFMV